MVNAYIPFGCFWTQPPVEKDFHANSLSGKHLSICGFIDTFPKRTNFQNSSRHRFGLIYACTKLETNQFREVLLAKPVSETREREFLKIP